MVGLPDKTTQDRPIGLLHATAMVVGILIGPSIP
jgi:hypothetical protein